jgi:tRNA-splicing ligase RtcB
MKARELRDLGVPAGPPLKRAKKAVGQARKVGLDENEIARVVTAVVNHPADHLDDAVFGDFAAAVERHAAEQAQTAEESRPLRDEPAPWKQWGTDLDAEAVAQMERACRLPVTVCGALMPDAHVGYGLPIGGVLATRNAVIPYAVGMDIACRMKLSVLDMPLRLLEEEPDRLRSALERETSFGVGADFKNRHEHPVMDEDWGVSPVTRKQKERAWDQLGTSGSGNHFAEFGVLEITEGGVGPGPGRYLALLSHSGSRGLGGEVCKHYSKLAEAAHGELPKELRALAWLDVREGDGEEYWAAMRLMGRYAAANHQLIHQAITRSLRAEVSFEVENHHNFAWQETHGGERLVVHRKGATPAGEGVLGVIPGSMATPGYVVRGLGNGEALNSAAHGAGRRMSRKEAKKRYSRQDLQRFLDERGVQLISGGLDEIPMAYKDIDEVMAAQRDLVEPVARFSPRLVKMAP